MLIFLAKNHSFADVIYDGALISHHAQTDRDDHKDREDTAEEASLNGDDDDDEVSMDSFSVQHVFGFLFCSISCLIQRHCILYF